MKHSSTQPLFAHAIVSKRKVTISRRRRVIGIPAEIDRAPGKKENVDLWLEGNKIVAEVY